MTINGKPIAILACLQFGAAMIVYIGGIAGAKMWSRLHDGFACTETIQFCVKVGPWPLLVPLLWTAAVLVRNHYEVSQWELAAWIAIAITFMIYAGFMGIGAAISPFCPIVG